MVKKVFILRLSLFFLCYNIICNLKAQEKINGYYISFDCCFKKDYVEVLRNNNIIYSHDLNSNNVTGLCDSASLFLRYDKKKYPNVCVPLYLT